MITDDIGDRGQSLFCLQMTQVCPGRTEPYFRLSFLGDKHPTFDYLVELVGTEPYFFFAQVKAMRLGYRQQGSNRRLRVNVAKEDVQRMVASPIPAYAFGIDVPLQLGYLLSLSGQRNAGLGGLPTRYTLDCNNLQRLWQEVQTFWVSQNMVRTPSYFV